jgi:hypothetical protein
MYNVPCHIARWVSSGAIIAVGLLLAIPLLAGEKPPVTLCFEAEAAQQITGKAFSIREFRGKENHKASGDKVLAIAQTQPGPSQPGAASYRIRIPQDGTYYLWTHVYWTTGCGNSFFLQLDLFKKAKLLLGGDSTYNTLHWVTLSDSGDNAGNPLPLRLKKGELTLTLGAKENGVMIDQLVLTTDAKFEPAGIYDLTPDVLVPVKKPPKK